MSTSLALPGQQAAPLVKLDGGLAGFNGAPQITIEQIDLVQNTTRAEGATPGKFRAKSTGQHVDELFAIPIGAQTKRVLFPEEDFGADPLCRSNDGNVPAPGVLKPVAKSCKTCPKGPSAWGAYNAAKRNGTPDAKLKILRPECDEKLEFLFLDKVTFRIMRLNVGGSSLSECKKTIKAIASEIQSLQDRAEIAALEAEAEGKQAQQQVLGMYDFMIHIKPHKITNSKGTFYVMNFKLGRTSFTSDAVKQRFAAKYNEKVEQLKQMFERANEEQEAQAVEQEYVDMEAQMPAVPVAGVNAPEPTIEAY